MAQFDLNKATTTDFTNKVPDFIVESMALDVANADGSETFIYYEKATENYGYYFNHPQIASRINSLCTWSFGQGYTVENMRNKVILEHVTGNGKETFNSIIWNHEAVKLMQGDAFMEIVKKDGILVNLINISPERVKTVFKDTRIIRYEIWNGKKWVKKKPREIFHSMNKKIGDSTRGTSQIQANKTVNDAMIESFEDERVIKHRDKALGIVYYKTNNAGKITFANSQIEKAVKNGEMVGMPEDTAKIEPYPSRSSEDRQNWISSRENFAFATFGIPRNMITSDGTSEVGGINGHLIFEQTYGKEQSDEEAAIWNQMARKIKFNRPPSLAPTVQDNQDANTGTTTIQPTEVTPSVNR